MNPVLTLETTAYTLEQLISLPEAQIALAGRSNVGKSSLINALAGRKKLAKVSSTPGKTRSVNYYKVTPHNFYLVDLPGYGYARTERKLVDQWTKVIFQYLRGRATLKRVMLLVDARHGLKPFDLQAMEALDEAAVSYQIVLTKVDKLKTAELGAVMARTAETAARHPAAHPVICPTSAETGLGIAHLRALAAEAAGLEPDAVAGYKPATS